MTSSLTLAQQTVQTPRRPRPTLAQQATVPSNGWINPVQGAPQPSGGSLFGAERTGHTHGGVDLNAPGWTGGSSGAGTPIRAAADGTVAWIYSDAGGFGVLLEHENGWQTKYQHLGSKDQTVRPYAVANGTRVRQGQIIGYMGDTGNPAAGAFHLHFSMLHNGITVDPMATGFYSGVVNLDRIDDSAQVEDLESNRTTLRTLMGETLSAASHAVAGGNRLSYAQILDERMSRASEGITGSQDEKVDDALAV